MGVVYVPGWHKGVQQGLDALARPARFKPGALQPGDHFLIAHLVALVERLDLLHLQQRELRLGDGQYVGAGGLDGQNFLFTADVVDHAQLGTGIAAKNVDHGAVAAQQVAAVDKSVQVRQTGGIAGIPEILRHRGPFQPAVQARKHRWNGRSLYIIRATRAV